MNSNAILILLSAITVNLIIIALSPVSDTWERAELLSKMYLFSQTLCFVSVLLDRRKGGISYMIEFFMLFFIALPALLQVNKHIFPWYASLQPVHICSAYGILAVCQISLHTNFILNFRRIEKSFKINNLHQYEPSSVYYTRAAIIIAIFAVILAVAAGPSNLLLVRGELSKADLQGASVQFLFMCRSLSLLAMIMFSYLAFRSKSSYIRKYNIKLAILFIPIFLIINYLPALPRFILFGLFIALSTIFINYFSVRIKALVAVMSVVILFIVFPTIKSLGSGELDTSGFSRRANITSVNEYLMRVDFDGFMQITSSVQYLMQDIGSIRYGENFLGVVLFFVPRAIWAAKPTDTGEIVATGLGFSYTNVSSPLPAEALMGFGIFGPIIIFYLLGRFVNITEGYVNPNFQTSTRTSSFFLYAITMGFIVIILRGALNGVAPQFATAFLVFYIMQFLLRNSALVRGN